MRPQPINTVLVVDPDPYARGMLAQQLARSGCVVLQATDGKSALEVLKDARSRDGIAVVVTELYLETGNDPCLVRAIRANTANRKTRIVAHTHRSLATDREWAMTAGADAYLIKPTRPQRMRYVVTRLVTGREPDAEPATAPAPTRRDSLDDALREIEANEQAGTSCVVFSRSWWEALSPAQRTTYRRRAKQARVSLRSDSRLGNHFVEVRGRTRGDLGLSSERPESPYRR